MPPSILQADRGFITRPDVLASGFDDRDIRRAIRSGAWTKIGPGLYAVASLYGALSPEEKHAVRTRAVAHRLGPDVVVSHHSAAILHGIDVWGVDLRTVHVTRLDTGRGRHEARVTHHLGRGVSEADVVEIDGVRTVSAARSVWEVACTVSAEAALVTADSGVHRGLITPDDMMSIAATFAHWQGSRRARLVFRLADGRAESPGESRSRYLFWRHGLPAPELQLVVVDAQGRFVGRTDFGWQHYRHLAEFDGRLKYSSASGESAQGVVLREKDREDALRAERWGMSRLRWHHLDPEQAPLTAERIRHDLEQSKRLYTHGRVHVI